HAGTAAMGCGAVCCVTISAGHCAVVLSGRLLLSLLKEYFLSDSIYLRPSGRAVSQLRPLSIEIGYTRHAEGSVLIKAGDTHVLCNASVLEKLPPFLRGQGQGWVTA